MPNNNERRSVDDLGVAVEVTGASYSLVGEREQANLFVRTDDFSILVFKSGAAYIVSNSTRTCANQCTFVIRYYTLLSRDSAWLSKQLKNGSSRPRASEAADRGKNAYPDGELQIAETPLEGGASLGYQYIALTNR